MKNEVALEQAVLMMAQAAEKYGLTPDDLIKLLDSGMSLQQLIEYVLAKQSGRTVEN
jgi:hypothetical protein